MKNIIKKSFVCAFAALATLVASAFDTPYLTFRSSMPFSVEASSQSWDGTIEYSTDAATWTTWTGSSISAAQSGGQYRIYLRGTGNTVVSNGSYWSLPAMGDVYCEGDIETLRDYNGNPPAMGASCYKSMFSGCDTLKSAPTLSATTLAVRCYDSMFAGCTILAEAPALPARTMVGYCYYKMFNDCTALKNPPELPAMDLASNCYAAMFAGCTSLISLPELPATTTLDASYYTMFDGCSSLVINESGDGVAWSLPTMVSAGSIYKSNMFRGTGGDFTGSPVEGKTYYVESALPPGLHIIKGKNELAAYTGASVDFDLAETIKGGATPYAFTGTVPTGLTLNQDGKLTGSLSVADTYNFTLTVTDSTSPDALTLNAAEYTLVVSDPDPLSSTTTDLGTAKVGKTKDIDLSDTISGGVPPYTFEFNGAHDAAFALAGSVLKFTPSAAQNYNCAITVKDALEATLPVTYTVAAIESAGFTDDDPDEPETGDPIDCLTPAGLLPRTCNKVTDSSTSVTWDNGWYYVTGNVTLSKGAVVNGKVSLILCDGATLTVTGSGSPDYSAGITVTEGNALTIYAQSTGANKGRLTASANFWTAAIGGSKSLPHAGTVNIYGGNISASGSFYGSGIGGAQNGNGGIVTINGGEVVATGYYSSGIGGGNGGTGGTLTVKGGTVSANGHTSTSSSYPGVGAYGSVDQGTLTVAANVVVKAGANASLTDEDIQNPNGETAISLATKKQYYSFEVAAPKELVQKVSELNAYRGESFRIVLSDTVSGGTMPYMFALKGGEEYPAGFTIDKMALYCETVTSGGTFILVVTDSGSQVKEFTYTVNVAVRPKNITYIDGADGVTELTGLAPTTYTPGTETPLPGIDTVRKPGFYAFAGWYRDAACTDGPVTAIPSTETADVTLYAKWHDTEGQVSYLMFTSSKPFSIKLPNSKQWDGTLEYKNTYSLTEAGMSFVGEDGWTTAEPAATMSAARENLDMEYHLWVRGSGNTKVTNGYRWQLTASATVRCYGDIKNLRDHYGTPQPMDAKCFQNMFSNWSELEKGPILSTTMLADYCYDGLFHNCEALAKAPALPATTLADYCYQSMFDGCTNLTVAPELPALEAKKNCYYQMFYGCTSLVAPPALPATHVTTNCYGRMFEGCSSLLLTETETPGVAVWSLPNIFTTASNWNANMFKSTGGDFTGDPTPGTTYYVLSAPQEGLLQLKNSFEEYIGVQFEIDLANTISGGVKPYRFELAEDSPSLPASLALSDSGVLSGIVVEEGSDFGNYPFKIKVSDDKGTEQCFSYTLHVAVAGMVDAPDEEVDGVPVDFRVPRSGIWTVKCRLLTEDDTVWTTGWYYAKGNLSFPNGVTVEGNVCIILDDEAVLTAVSPDSSKAAVDVSAVGYVTNSLTIYGQAEGTGRFIATGTGSSPAIGISYDRPEFMASSSFDRTCTGNVTINGGVIVAQGGENAAGIGSCAGKNGGNIVINGGSVSATGGTNGAGIGTGSGRPGSAYSVVTPGIVTIQGGAVRAVGGTYGAGIGGGKGWFGATVNIFGGMVTAIGGEESTQQTHGIGRGWNTDSNAKRGHLYVHEGMLIEHGSAENLPSTTSTESRDPVTHEFSFAHDSPSFRWFLIEPEGSNPLVANTNLGTVVKGDWSFSRPFNLYVSGGVKPYAFTLASADDHPGNRLPGGLSINDEGSLIGTPTEAGYFEFWVTVTDSDIGAFHRTSDFLFTLRVYDVFDIVYYEKDGTTRVYPSPATYTYVEGTGISAQSMPVPTKTGYDFAGWYDNTALEGEAITSISEEETGDKEFYAKWTPTEYLITYYQGTQECSDGDTHEGLEPTTYTIESADIVLPMPEEKEGWYFAGWYDNSDLLGFEVKTIPSGSTGDKEYYSKWDMAGVPFAPVENKNELYGDAGMDDMWILSQTVSGGKKPYTFALKDMEDNHLPAGLELSEDGVLSGSVTVAGVYEFTVLATDSLSQTTEVNYTLEIDLAKTTGNGDPDATVYIGFPVSVNLATAIVGGTAPYTFALTSAEDNALPSGLSLNGSMLEGTVTMKGNSHFWLTVTDSNGVSSELRYWIYSQSNTAQQNFTINGVNWSWVEASPPKQDGKISLWNADSLVSDGKSVIPVDTEGYVYVPDHIGALTEPVTCIGRNAFRDCSAIVRITLPPTITDIGENAFTGCTALREIVIPSSVVNINANAFGPGNLHVYVEKGQEDRIRALFEASGCNMSYITFFERDFFTYTLDANLGNELEMREITVVDGLTIGSLPKPTRYNYTFEFWSWDKIPLSVNPEDMPSIQAGDQTLYAKWTSTCPAPVFTIENDWRGVAVLKSVELNGNTEIVIPDTVEEIGKLALYNKDTLLRVTIPDTVKNIETGSFQDCEKLREVYMPSSLTNIGLSAFTHCSSLQIADIPGSVESIGDFAFAWCSNIVNMTIGRGLKFIGDSAFYNCVSLEGDTRHGLVIPDTVKRIGDTAFYNTGVKAVTLPKGIYSGDRSFFSCKRLVSVNVGGEVKILLSSRRRLLGAAPSDETSLGKYAFSGCSELESATFGSSVSNVGGGVFAGCTKLKSITVESGGNYASQFGMLLSLDLTTLVSAYGEEEDITVPSGVTTIAAGAFADYTTVTNVTLPRSVTTIGEEAFSNATALVSAWIPKNVTDMGSNAFYGTRLATVHVMEGDTSRMRELVSGCGYAVAGVMFIEDYPEETKPSIPGDPGANVTGNADDGYTITPSTTAGTVEVTIPSGVDAEKVTVEVPLTATVKPNGANIAVIVKDTNDHTYDISEFLNLPSPNESGEINLAQSTLNKEAVFEETTDGDNQKNTEEVLEAAMDDESNSATIKSAKPGLWYSMEASNDLSFPAGENTKSGAAKMATSETVNIAKPDQKPSGKAVFFRIKVSATN